VCAAVTRQAQEAGRRVSRAKEWAEFQASAWFVRNGRYGKIELDPINGNGELTETENVSYGVITEFLRMNVILTYFATGTATATDT